MGIDPLKDLLAQHGDFATMEGDDPNEALACADSRLVILTDDGRVYQCSGGTIVDMMIAYVHNGAEMLEHYHQLALRRE